MRNSQVRRSVVAVCVFVLLCASGALYVRWSQRIPLPVPEVQLQSPNGSEQNTVTPVGVVRPKGRPSAPILPKATLHSRQVVNAVAGVDRPERPLTREEALQWKKNLEQLIQLGADGVAAIAEFLQTKRDIIFDRDATELLGFRTARALLFAVLARIGGAEAIGVTWQALQSSSDPREIALLAQNLDTLAPEIYREDSVTAARNLLAQAEAGKSAGVDVAALFEVLQNYGGAEIVPDLERMSHTWQYYSAIALAGLPEGAGTPALIEMAQRNGPAATMALQLLAQLSTDQFARAGLALFGQAQANKIPAEAWPLLVPTLAGNQFLFLNSGFTGPDGRTHPGNISTAHVNSGNQTFYNAFIPGSLTQEAINQRLAVIDQLRGVCSQPAALQALQQAADLLMNRVPTITASVP